MIHLPTPGLRLRRNFLAALALLTAFTAALHAAPTAWLKLETSEFVIYSDAPEKQVVECALRYAAFRRAFAELFLEPGHALPPSSFLLFKKDKSFRDLTPASTEKNTKTVNFSTEIDGTPLSTFSLAGDRDRALEMTFEFETIWALRRIGHFVPVWMSQGAGEVLSSVTLEKGRCLLGEQSSHSFDDEFEWPRFFEINESSKAYRESGEDLSHFLNQAWGLMHWILLSEGDSRARFEALESELRTHPAIDAVPTVMRTPVAQLTKAIYHHPKRARAIPFDEIAVRAGFRISPAPQAEVLVKTSDLLCANNRLPEANAQLDQARALAPDLALVKEGLARRMLREGRQRDAIQLYREAIDAGSTNFVAYLQSATMRLNDNMTRGADLPGEGGFESMKAIVEMRRALQLNPGNLECYRVLGRAFYVSPQVTAEQIDELAPGVTTGQAGQCVRCYRALLYSRLHRRGECAGDFRDILADPNLTPQVHQSVQKQYIYEVVSADAREVDKFIRARDYASAFALIADGEKDAEPELRDRYQHLRAQVGNLVRHDPEATPAERKLAGLE